MGIENVVIARKLSVLERYCQEQNVSISEGVAKFRFDGRGGERVVRSFEVQLESYKRISDALNDANIVEGDNLDQNVFKNAKLVASLGGDNYFQLVSHLVDNQLIVGINSDPENSSGALTYFTADSFIDYLPRLRNGDFDVENWTRLQTKLNGQTVPVLTISEIYVGAYKSTNMSTYVLDSEEQKSSGVIIATPAGLTGWYKAVANDYELEADTAPIARTDYHAYFVVREPFTQGEKKYMLTSGRINPNQKLSIQWLAHGYGLLSIDSVDEHEIRRTDEIEVAISDKSLRVIKPRYES